ncbi:serine hydrolase [Bacillus sp. JJ722]|uniref:serine hydrolase n=1 Tax=Bacillus sp. JJ722 TaxID=3122973 RepID=UPI003000AAFC
MEKKTFHKRWWGVALIALIGVVILGTILEPSEKEKAKEIKEDKPSSSVTTTKLRKVNLKKLKRSQPKVPGLSITLIERGQMSSTENYGLLEVGSDKNVDKDSIFCACSISKFLTGMLSGALLQY